jgi:hypothetical protein
MTIHITDAQIFRPDPSAPTKRWVLPCIAEATNAVLYDKQPNVSQPFRYANGSGYGDFTVGNRYWLLGVSDNGRQVWFLRLVAVRPGGKDVVLDFDEI